MKKTFTILIKKQKGFSLLEMLIYVAILAFLMVTVVATLITMTRSYSILKVSKNLNHAAIVSLERMTREIRGASSVVVGQSTLDASPGRLYLQVGTDTTEFYLDAGMLKVNVNGVYQGPLTTADVAINSLIFTLSTTTESEAIKIDLMMESGVNERHKREQFQSTVVLRGSYN